MKSEWIEYKNEWLEDVTSAGKSGPHCMRVPKGVFEGLRSVWIQLIFAENWKHCSKTIFKCVNSTVGPIFNEKVAKNYVNSMK